jgi:hypothetical protein
MTLRPDEEEDPVALIGSMTTPGMSEGSSNWGVIGHWVSHKVAGGFGDITRELGEAWDQVINAMKLFDKIDIDDAWLYNLGRQETPLWGKPEWSEALVPPDWDGSSGAVDRFKCANQFTIGVVSYTLLRAVLGAVSIKDILRTIPRVGKVIPFTALYRMRVLDRLGDIHDELSDEQNGLSSEIAEVYNALPPNTRNDTKEIMATLGSIASAWSSNDKAQMNQVNISITNYLSRSGL